MTGLHQVQSFCSRFMGQLDVIHMQMGATLLIAHENYKCNFDKSGQATPQIYSGQNIIVDRPLVQMLDAANIASALWTDLLHNTLCPFEIISATLDRVTVDANGMYNTDYKDRVVLALNSAE